MNYAKIATICFLFLICSCKGADNMNVSSKMNSACGSLIDDFFKKMESNNFKGAINDLLLSNPNIDSKDSATIAMKDRFSSINFISGAYRGRSLLKKRGINDALAIYSYLVKYDKKFYRFVFTFYDNGDQTKIYKFSFDDSIEIELEESVKLYM
jgi:hypothetical protein